MTTTTRILVLIAVGIALLSTFGLLSARRRAQQQRTLPAHLAIYMHVTLITAMVTFAAWPILHYIGLRTSSALRDVPSAPFMLASATALAAAVGLGGTRLIMALTSRRRQGSPDTR